METKETKTTDELRHEIKAATDIEDYLKNNESHMKLPTLSEYLKLLLSQKGLRRADVVRGSLLDKAYMYQIFAGKGKPSRDKLLALAFGLCLTDDEAQKMLKLSCNRELYARDERDVLILFALQSKLTAMEANDLLFRHGFPLLGVCD